MTIAVLRRRSIDYSVYFTIIVTRKELMIVLLLLFCDVCHLGTDDLPTIQASLEPPQHDDYTVPTTDGIAQKSPSLPGLRGL